MGFGASGGVLRKGGTTGLAIGAAMWAALSPSSAKAIQVDAAEAPDNNLALTVSAIQGAQSSILLNIYELDAPEITDALLAKIKSGVNVRILEEGQPVGGITTAAKGAQYQLQTAMESASSSDDALFEMTSKAGGKRRYHYDHAKYAVIDGNELLVGSENYSPTGNPEPGSVGNRGWEVVIHDQGIAEQFTSIFGQDAVTTYGDVLALVGGSTNDSMTSLIGTPEAPADGVALEDFARRPRPVYSHRPEKPRPTEHKPKPEPQPVPQPAPEQQPSATQNGSSSYDASSVQPITSPNTSLDGLVGAIQNAQTSIDIEQMTFNSEWNSETPTSPVLDAVIAAAKRGVRVRVLLNDESVFNQGQISDYSKPINVPTAQQLNAAASAGGLQLEARIADVKAMGVDYIHNKGMLIDGTETLISSINWDENSITNNREAAVLITSPDVYGYYEGLFSSDWNNSASLSQNPVKAKAATVDAISETSAAPLAILDCPSAVSVQVDFGKVGQTDPDFVALAGKSYAGTFSLVSADDHCLYSDGGRGSSSSGSQSYVEIKAMSSGYSVLLEGYAPKSEKIYSVRARISSLNGDYSGIGASVYDGSGTHQRIGDASLSISF